MATGRQRFFWDISAAIQYTVIQFGYKEPSEPIKQEQLNPIRARENPDVKSLEQRVAEMSEMAGGGIR